MRVKNNVYINLRTDFNSAVKRIYVNFSRIIDTHNGIQVLWRNYL